MDKQLQIILKNKQSLRKELAAKPIAEKLWMLESLSERTFALRPESSVTVPNEPWPIPNNWKWEKMGDVATIIGGSTPRTDQPDYFGGDIPWITPSDLANHTTKTISHGAKNISTEGLQNSGATLLPVGTVLFSTRAPIGYVAITATQVATNQGCKSFVMTEKVIPDFVYYYLQHARKLIVQMANGTTFLELSGKKAAQIPIPVAPLPEQHRIVAEIEKQFSLLEKSVASQQAECLRQAVLQKAFTGKLVKHFSGKPYVQTLD